MHVDLQFYIIFVTYAYFDWDFSQELGVDFSMYGVKLLLKML